MYLIDIHSGSVLRKSYDRECLLSIAYGWYLMYSCFFLLANELTNVLGNGQNPLLLQPSAHELQTDMLAIIDLWVICRTVSKLGSIDGVYMGYSQSS